MVVTLPLARPTIEPLTRSTVMTLKISTSMSPVKWTLGGPPRMMVATRSLDGHGLMGESIKPVHQFDPNGKVMRMLRSALPGSDAFPSQTLRPRARCLLQEKRKNGRPSVGTGQRKEKEEGAPCAPLTPLAPSSRPCRWCLGGPACQRTPGRARRPLLCRCTSGTPRCSRTGSH